MPHRRGTLGERAPVEKIVVVAAQRLASPAGPHQPELLGDLPRSRR
ncbi:MAG: hypothetical protein AVDCRST_MAG64-2904 [uncultured Phycisphaerae bacterium]|uniref:Uncharacterized protein n=1 Tax=uncultured Phycisphaerae bacterium TaxID=904963 RepID=A0A6J4PTB6_9BACT|nr:MAG: hypothetical protein AVDCRST_MAG64-2904 [uncultured Phycisphaerae bacterium]